MEKYKTRSVEKAELRPFYSWNFYGEPAKWGMSNCIRKLFLGLTTRVGTVPWPYQIRLVWTQHSVLQSIMETARDTLMNARSRGTENHREDTASVERPVVQSIDHGRGE